MRKRRYRRRYKGHGDSGIIILVGLALLVQFRDVLLIAIILLSLLLIAFGVYKRIKGNKWLQSIDMSVVDNMKGTEFEVYISKLLPKCGYTDVRLTPYNDSGGDIVCRYKGQRIVFQCKRQKDPVGNGAVQESHTAKTIYACNRDIVITNNSFTRRAKHDAALTGTSLWDRNDLINLIHEATAPSRKTVSPLFRYKPY